MGSPTLKNGIIDKDPESTALSTVSGILEAALPDTHSAGPGTLDFQLQLGETDRKIPLEKGMAAHSSILA